MAGMPRRRATHLFLNSLSPADQEEFIWEMRAAGSAQLTILNRLMLLTRSRGFTGLPLTMPGLMSWIKMDPERKKTWDECSKMRGEIYADEAVQIVDDAAPEHPLDSMYVRKAEARSKLRQWRAASADREQFDHRPQTGNQTTITVNNLQLNAARTSSELFADVHERRIARGVEVSTTEAFVEPATGAEALFAGTLGRLAPPALTLASMFEDDADEPEPAPAAPSRVEPETFDEMFS